MMGGQWCKRVRRGAASGSHLPSLLVFLDGHPVEKEPRNTPWKGCMSPVVDFWATGSPLLLPNCAFGTGTRP